MRCKIENCSYESEDLVKFSRHLQFTHKMKSEEYSIKYLCGEIRPVCHKCGGIVRYVQFAFKKYCKEHSFMAESEAGALGGKIKKSWNKGLTKERDLRIMEYSNKYKGAGNPFYGKTHPSNVVNDIRKKKLLSEEEVRERLDKRAADFEFFFSYDDYKSRQYQYIKVMCKICRHEEEKTLTALERGSRCEICYPLNVSSKPEQDIENYLRELGVLEIERNSRKIISPKEIDIFLPNDRFAIEYNGLFWHSEERVGSQLHLAKTRACLEKDVSLFHIFSDEWLTKEVIVKSMIRHKLGCSEYRIMARKCVVRMVENKLARHFFKENHIAGDGGAIKVAFGLFYQEKLVGCLALKRPYARSADEKTIENARFALQVDTVIAGGFSRLLKCAINWAKEKGYNKIKSFADRRFGEGKVYEICGFKLVGSTKSNYWYTDGERRYFRTRFRAANGKSERQIAEENGVWRVFGCGSNIYEMTLSP